MPWWTRESSRQLTAGAAALLCLLVPGDALLKVLAGWDLYAGGYLLLTWLAYRRRETPQLYAMALETRRRRGHRFLVAAPEQLSQAAASLSLTVTISALPRVKSLDAPPLLAFAVCVVAVICCWLMLQTGFALGYLGRYAEAGGLYFPGDEEPGLADFFYFSVAVGTTFGTTDVTVTQRRIRRQVLLHGSLAFFFNTLILAVVVTIVTSYLRIG